MEIKWKLIGTIGRYKVRHSINNDIDQISIIYKTHVKKINKWDSDYENVVKLFSNFEQDIDNLFRFRR